jgi:hypothetical protein
MMRRALLFAVLSCAACDWAPFGNDDPDTGDGGDDEVLAPVPCAGSICLTSGGIRTLAGPALRSERLSVHSAGFEPTARSCSGELCVTGGVEP